MSAELSPLQRAFLALEETRSRLSAVEYRQREPIAIVGMGCRFPGSASSPRGYWQLLDDARSAITTVPATRWDHAPFFDATSSRVGTTYAEHAGFLESAIDEFDAAFFGISPREAGGMDPQQRLLLEVAWEALENAGIAPDRLAGSATGVFVGIPSADYQQLQLRGGSLDDIDAHYASGIAHSIASGRLSYLLGLNGPSLSLDTACSSSLVAVHLACQNLRAGDCDLALAAGVNLILTPESFIAFGRTQMLSSDGRCKPFDASADGFVRGEGCGVVVLKRLSDARADGDRVLAVIRGSAVNQDGASASLTAPSGPAQEAVIRRALAQSGLTGADVHVVEAHGTGTPLGDPIELRALGAVYGGAHAANAPLVVGSVKANVGHLEGAAGVASLIKAVLMLETARVPSQLYIEQPTPHVDWKTLHLRLPMPGGEAWPAHGTRRAAVSSFGFSGTNAHLIVEQAADVVPARNDRPVRPLHIVPIAGKSAHAVRELAAGYAAYIDADTPLENLAHTAAMGRAQLLGARAAVVTGDAASAREMLRAIASGAQITEHAVGASVRAAFLFTGQGSQYPDMGRELYDTAPPFTASIDASSAVLAAEWNGVQLGDVLYGPDSARLLADARYVQPAIVAVELALASLWHTWGVEPTLVAGHSLGEYAAAAFAGVMSTADALRLVAARGRLMAELPLVDAAMTSVPAGVAAASGALGDVLRGEVELAADNGPSQCVLTGRSEAIGRAEASLRERLGVECKRLVATTNAFHSREVEPMLDAFERIAATITYTAPRIPVSWNLGRAALEPHRTPTAAYWRRQTRETVQFGDVIAALRERRVTHAIEIGPHPVLTGMVAAADDSTLPSGIASLRRGRGAWETLANGVAQWWTSGGRVDWVAFDAPYALSRTDLPTYPFEREKHWLTFARVGARPNRDAGGHPLVGTRVSSPAMTGIVFEREVAAPMLPLLDQHRVFGNAILPGAAWLDACAVAGGAAYAGTDWAVCGLTLHAPLHVRDDRPRVVQIVLSRAGDAIPQVAAYSRDAADAAGAWLLHAEATLEPRRAAPVPAPLAWPTDGDETRDQLYARFARIGLTLGSQFQLMRHTSQSGQTALATVTSSGAAAWPDGIVNPVLIDACIQAIALVAPHAPDGHDALYMPFAIERFEWFGTPGDAFVCAVSRREGAASGETIVADVVAADVGGRTIGVLRGVTLKRATPETLRLVTGRSVRDDLYEMTWEAQDQAAPGHQASLSLITQRVVERAPDHAAAESLVRYSADGPAMDRLAALYVWRALEQLGADLSLHDTLVPETLRRELGVLASHAQLFTRLLDILVDDGVLRREGADRVVAEPLDSGGIADAIQALRGGETPFGGELDLLVRCGEALAPALTGTIDALTLLFPDGSLDQVHRIYRDSPFPRTYNALVRDAVATLMAGRIGAQPLRVLEVGGGTGGTTAAILDAIPDGASEYLFTDTSPLFLTRARDRFSTRNGMSYRVFDLEQDATSQGFTPGSFDLIIAANVIHATRDVATTLGMLRTLLAPDGVLLMLELSRPSRWIDLSFGFTTGWWAFDDAFRTDYPLLPAAEWQRVLMSVGFGETAIALGTNGAGDGLEEQFVMLARTPAVPVAPSDGLWIVVAPPGGGGSSLANAFEARGERVARVSPTAIGDALRAELSAAFSAVRGPILGVVNCLELDTASRAGDELHMAALATASAVRALAVAQAMLTMSHDTVRNAMPRLWCITRSSVRVSAADAAPLMNASPVWGIVRTLQLEHPELAASCLDLPATASAADIDAVVSEVRAGAPEQQTALRDAQRLVARVKHVSRAAPAFPTSYVVAPRTRGTIDALAIDPRDIPAPGAGEVVIRVAATGLNFKDVLNVLGTYPGDAGAIGGECAGVVVAAGADVRSLAVGDRVVGLASGAMSSHVCTPESLVVPLPDGMSFDTASSLPIAYLTAHHTLIELGRLQRGERILIHAGAGGVGLAAIRIAQRVGAEIFATAGSDSKRGFLRGLGVSHVFDSRSAAFSNEILALTNGEGVHVTLNSLSDDFVERSLAVTARGGRFLEIGKRGIWTAEQVAALGRQLEYHIVDWTGIARTSPERVGRDLRALLDDIARGELAALPTTVFPLSRVHDAFRYMAQGRHTGKIVISHREALDAEGANAVEVKPGVAYVITGGTSGLGLRTAEWLVDRGATHLMLCSRSGAGDALDDVRASLEARGVRVDVAAVDVADVDALDALLSRVRNAAPIHGVIHSAGLLDDGAVLQLDEARVARVFAAKVSGSWNLHRLTLDDRLDFFVCFASVAGFFGSPGQANHAAANTFIDALAHHRRAEGRPAVSIDWGAWEEIGAAVRHGALARAANIGVRSITVDAGLAMLDEIFSGAPAQLAAVPVDWPAFRAARGTQHLTVFDRVAQLTAASAAPVARASGAVTTQGTDVPNLVVDLTAAVAARRPALLRSFLKARVSRTLGLGASSVLDDRQPLRDAGLDSLLAIELRNVIGTAIGRTLPATLLFDYPTIDDLATHLITILFPDSIAPTVAAESAMPGATPGTLVDDLTSMSDDDVDRLFAERMKGK
ncbi:MAG: SDR family NAD(P)-dependent oxidoreductase [Gemmatimonadaceae bacterium]|nr:SDR family NAD(P)-dependent oxidoreductase [Gemmatimonadaceae bacterium]